VLKVLLNPNQSVIFFLKIYSNYNKFGVVVCMYQHSRIVYQLLSFEMSLFDLL